MMFNLTTESGAVLTERWHDQTLDLESLTFDEPGRKCVFSVTEVKPDKSEKVALLQSKQLQRCRVAIKNVARVQVLDAEGEVELYINEIEASPTTLRVKCVNGVLEVVGEAMEANLEVEAADTDAETEVNLTTPLGDVSWRRKHTKPQS
jgi:hypothetical protein